MESSQMTDPVISATHLNTALFQWQKHPHLLCQINLKRDENLSKLISLYYATMKLFCICLLYLLCGKYPFHNNFWDGSADRKKKGKDTWSIQTKGTKHFCTRLGKMISLLCDLLLQIARQRPNNKNTGKHNIKSKLSEGLKKPNPAHRWHSLNSLPFLGSSYTQTITQPRSCSLLLIMLESHSEVKKVQMQTLAWALKQLSANRPQDRTTLGNCKMMGKWGERRNKALLLMKRESFLLHQNRPFPRHVIPRPVPRTGVSP